MKQIEQNDNKIDIIKTNWRYSVDKKFYMKLKNYKHDLINNVIGNILQLAANIFGAGSALYFVLYNHLNTQTPSRIPTSDRDLVFGYSIVGFSLLKRQSKRCQIPIKKPKHNMLITLLPVVHVSILKGDFEILLAPHKYVSRFWVCNLLVLNNRFNIKSITKKIACVAIKYIRQPVGYKTTYLVNRTDYSTVAQLSEQFTIHY